MDILAETKRNMRFIGWEGPADTGFTHKLDARGNIIARAHDATWHADYEAEEARARREQARQDRERAAQAGEPGA